MPIEIRELNIKINVSQGQGQGVSSDVPSTGGAPSSDKNELISECLEQVAEMIKNNNER